ncbi:universal stress protein [Pedobacter sp. BG31]|uniref:universal stress protein n=1 Tax=Pedobacter sp. BG31 TaxID=3349697 RepID=UPI0035F30C17
MECHKILIAIDDSPAAEHIAGSGYQLACQFGAEVALLSIEDTTIYDDDELSLRERDPLIERSSNTLQQYLINKIFKNVPVSTFIERGKPASVIIELSRSWNADMIVLGTHGRKGLSHLLMGSVAEEVMRNSSKPLVIIPISEKR